LTHSRFKSKSLFTERISNW